MKHARAFHPLDPRGARPRLISAIVLGSLAWFVVPGRMEATTRALLAWDVASFVLLAIGLFIIARADARETRRRAAAYDPGRRAVWLLVLAASAFGLFAAAVVIRQGRSPASFEGQLHIALCVVTVAISWLLTHSAFTLRYAHLYYRGEGNGGIEFPGKQDPDDLDFAYFGFTIGMTFQVSDAVITDRGIRRTVLRHALLSFMYNTIILALALNLIVGQFG